MENQLKKLINKLEISEKKVTELQNDILKLREENEELRDANDSLEQYTRRNSVRIFGIKEGESEDIYREVLDPFKNQMEVPITKDHIDRCHRVGRFKVGAKPRPVIVKFVSYGFHSMVFNSKRKLKGSGIIVCEDLTKIRVDILNNAVEQFGGIQSQQFIVPSGVPRGSNLGPLLFLLIINDLPSYIKGCECLIFANDVKTYKEVANVEDCHTLQHNRVRNLGVNLRSDLRWDDHVEKIVNTSLKSLAFLMRSIQDLKSVMAIQLLYNSLVRSKLEFASAIWNSGQIIH
ncbi:hypothetical protein ILUMI_01188 [Ignelater luminosus]|uniref:Reverse transcriptase domain-containing protein n=1 Tax=Ignelater luminosus TaxID=2038154 RepID=A0A8K0DKH3_IGNLU|nr:hypothetical protein ILUMI_01188 [Ignelater luminosus]